MIVAAMVGVLVLLLGNFVLAMFGVGGGEGLGLRSGGPVAIMFSLFVIALAAFSFLIDFDAADQMIRAGAPEKAAWGRGPRPDRNAGVAVHRDPAAAQLLPAAIAASPCKAPPA